MLKAKKHPSKEQTIKAWSLDEKDGWPVGIEEIFIDLREENLFPDGAVVDAQGNLWIVNPYCTNGNSPVHVRSPAGDWMHYSSF